MLPLEYDTFIEVIEDEGLDEEFSTHKTLCYYVMNESSMNEYQAIFERPDMAMQNHLKSLYIRAKVNGVRINKVLIECGTCVNVMPQSLLVKIGKYAKDLACNNMVLSNYGGKTSKPLGVI